MLFGNLQGEDAITLLSAELLGATGRAIGLDTLRLERGFETDEFRADPGLIATEIDPSTRLTISKRLRPDVEVILSQSLQESGGLSTILSYKPRAERRAPLRLARQPRSRGVAPSRDHVRRRADRRRSTRPPQPEIVGGHVLRRARSSRRPSCASCSSSKSATHSTSTTGSATSTSCATTIRIATTTRSASEARRQPGEDGQTIALELPHHSRARSPSSSSSAIRSRPDLEDELRDSWRRTIFDRFLIEDIESRIRRHLVGRGHHRQHGRGGGRGVDARRRKQVRVTVQPGATGLHAPRSSTRGMRRSTPAISTR